MSAGIHDVIGPVRALERVANFADGWVLDFAGGAGQAVCAANFLHGFGGNGEGLVSDGEQDDRLRAPGAPRLRRFLRGDFHRTPTGTRRHNFVTRLSIAALISSSGST